MGGDAWAGVGYLDHHCGQGVLPVPRRASIRSRPLWHRVQGVGDGLEKRLLQLHGIHPHGRQHRRELDLERDAALAKELGDSRHQLFDQPCDTLLQRVKRRGREKLSKWLTRLSRRSTSSMIGREVFARCAGLGVAKRELRGCPKTGERVS